MKLNHSDTCPHCGKAELRLLKTYETVHNGIRQLFRCADCGCGFSETHGTPMEHLKTPLSQVAGIFRVRSEGMGLRATGRVFGVHKNSVTEWEERFAAQKAPLMLYALCHEFIRLTFEGDEWYTVTGKRGEPAPSEGWTAVILERGRRFITSTSSVHRIEQRGGPKDAEMFRAVMNTVTAYLQPCAEVTFLSDGERRYGNTLFERCAEVLRNGGRGRPPKTLPSGVRVRRKNKGAQNSKPGRKRPKPVLSVAEAYEAPHREHPDTEGVPDADIPAHHVEAQNAALRRRNSAFRRRSNTYAKNREALQRTLDVHQIIHNPSAGSGQALSVLIGRPGRFPLPLWGFSQESCVLKMS